jgi:hypothetical protein
MTPKTGCDEFDRLMKGMTQRALSDHLVCFMLKTVSWNCTLIFEAAVRLDLQAVQGMKDTRVGTASMDRRAALNPYFSKAKVRSL